jgi:hypothetical protein
MGKEHANNVQDGTLSKLTHLRKIKELENVERPRGRWQDQFLSFSAIRMGL